MKILAVDPGTVKCGLAVVCAEGGVLVREVAPSGELVARALELAGAHQCVRIVLGRGTGSEPLRKALVKASPIAVDLVDEEFTTLRARERYFQEHPPRGFWRLVPVSLQNPREPFDDYVAIILAERWFERAGGVAG